MQPLRDRLCVEVLHIAMHIGHTSLTIDVPLLILTIINTNRLDILHFKTFAV